MGKLLRRLSVWIHRRRLEHELEEEMAAHREMMPLERRPHFGSTLRLQEDTADQWGFAWIDQLRQDLAYGARSLRRSPGFALTAIAVLSLGIGVNLAEVHIFIALLHNIQVRDVDSLCHFNRVTRQRETGAFSLPEIEFYRRNNTVLSAVLTETFVTNVYYAQDSKEVRSIAVSGNYFAELGIAPLYGRLLNERDDRPGAPPVVVLSYDYWQNRFGGDPGLIMRTIRFNDKPVQVVGVAPPQFGGLSWQAQAWIPVAHFSYLNPDSSAATLMTEYRPRWTSMWGRLNHGVSRQRAQDQLRTLIRELSKQQPEFVSPGDWIQVQPAQRQVPSSPSEILLITTFVLLVLLVLVSACANLGNMLLARGLVRQREIDIRLAVGAGKARLVRQLMTENLLLAAVASVASLIVGKLAALLVLRIVGAASHFRIVTDWRIVSACAAFGLCATLAFGLAPALQIVKGGPKATRARKILVSIQVAASCVLLIVSSFFMRGIRQSFHTEVAFDYSNLALVDPGFYWHHYRSPAARGAALEMAARLRKISGIEAACVATIPPIRRSRIDNVSGHQLYLNEVDPAYFDTMRLTVLVGHVFGPDEPDAAVVSESAARRLWPNQSPLGKSLPVARRSRTVVGVAKDSGANLLRHPDSVEVYLPVSDENAPYLTILVRTARDPAPMSATIRAVAAEPGLTPLVFTYQGLIDQELEGIRKMVQIIGSLAGVASLLALLGIFGLLAFTVAQRTREIGVRMALGARGPDVLRIVVGQYSLPFGVGVVSGVVLAAAATKVFRNLVYGFIPFEVWSFGTGLLLFALVALVASIVPARQALRVDPSSALRYE